MWMRCTRRAPAHRRPRSPAVRHGCASVELYATAGSQYTSHIRRTSVTTRRGVGFVFALIGLAVLVSAAAMVVLFVSLSGGVARTARVTSSSAALVLRPDGDLPELRPDDVFDQFVDRGADSLRGFARALRRAKTDPRIT